MLSWSRDADGSGCRIIGVPKAIRAALHKRGGGTLHVITQPR